ncbi:uncharacterized protein LOC111908298 [Lactuca sativa]|uniref:uncharacterized protein LOC111908298 n=1 Tax=Lactuca sativa TaxID=4236 RepID=UPI001C689930|nr:uncharacterized protein LOC111908298 [Lactuca sativa]
MFPINQEKTKQITLDKNNPIKEKLKMNAWDKIATWAYSVGLPFNVVRDESMPAPSYHNIHVTLMKKRLEDTQKFVDSFRPHWEEYRLFLKSIDASEHVKNAQLIVEMINEVIKDVGEENMFITDNGSNFKVAGKILEEQHPKLFWTPCAAHCVNLMIGDIGEKIPKIKTALTDARAIVVYIYNHRRILNLMRKLTKNKELHRSCVTRFATQFYTIQSIHENRHHIQVLFVSEEWRKSDFAKQAVGKKVEQIVARKEFWDNIHLACQVLAPLVDVVRLVHTEDKPCMGYIDDAMDIAKEQIKKNLTGTPNERMITTVWAMIQTRWTDQLHHPLHAAGCYLNPAIFHGENSREIRKNRDIATGLYVAIDPAIRARTKVAPYIWWRTYGIDTPLLQTFAITVLSQTCSASPCEATFNEKKLSFTTKNDLVFIQYNTRLQRRFNSLKANRSLDPILLRDVDENDDWVIPTEVKLQEFVDGRDGLLWSAMREPMGGTEEVRVTARSKRDSYRDDNDDDDDIRVEVEDLDEQLDALGDVGSEEDFMSYD